jgi:hypothetical protein
MANTKFFPDLPEFDDSNLEAEIEAILVSDALVLKKLSPLLQEFEWNEKMAVGQVAYSLIDRSPRQLIKLLPQYGEFDAPVKQAIEFVERLSPQALAELAADILQEDFEIREIREVENEDRN